MRQAKRRKMRLFNPSDTPSSMKLGRSMDTVKCTAGNRLVWDQHGNVRCRMGKPSQINEQTPLYPTLVVREASAGKGYTRY